MFPVSIRWCVFCLSLHPTLKSRNELIDFLCLSSLPKCCYKERRNKFVESSSCTTSQGSKVGQVAEKWVLTLAAEPVLEDGVLGCCWWKGWQSQAADTASPSDLTALKKRKMLSSASNGPSCLEAEKSITKPQLSRALLPQDIISTKVAQIHCHMLLLLSCRLGVGGGVHSELLFSPSQKGCNSLGG